MVRIVDEGSHFDAPMEKVWKLVEAHREHISAIHPDVKNPRMEAGGENQGVTTWEQEMNGRKMTMKLRVTLLPPFGQTLEFLDGPMAGSKMINYYTPKGNRTAVTVIGDFVSPMLPESQVEGMAWEFLQGGFDQDSAYLKKMR